MYILQTYALSQPRWTQSRIQPSTPITHSAFTLSYSYLPHSHGQSKWKKTSGHTEGYWRFVGKRYAWCPALDFLYLKLCRAGFWIRTFIGQRQLQRGGCNWNAGGNLGFSMDSSGFCACRDAICGGPRIPWVLMLRWATAVSWSRAAWWTGHPSTSLSRNLRAAWGLDGRFLFIRNPSRRFGVVPRSFFVVLSPSRICND